MSFFIVRVFFIFHACTSLTLQLHGFLNREKQAARPGTSMWSSICHISGQSSHKSVTRYFVVCAAHLLCSHVFKSLLLCKRMNTCEIMALLTVRFSWVLPSHRKYLSNTSESLDHIKAVWLLLTPAYTVVKTTVNTIINRNCFCQTGNHSTPMYTLSKNICK